VSERLARALFLASLFLLPWGGLLPLGALHEHAQWNDVVFALASAAWLAQRVRRREPLRPRPLHAALALYLGWAVISYLCASPRPAAGAGKLLGMAMLAALFVVSSDWMDRPGMPAAIARTLAASSLLTGLAAVVGVGLALSGRLTSLVGPCGDLLPGLLARAQAGFPHPNLLASFCIFGSAVAAREDAGLSRNVRLAVQFALGVSVLLTSSRAILGFALSALVRHATTPSRRRLVTLAAVPLLLATVALTVFNVALDPLRPWQARLLAPPSPRLQAAQSGLATLGRHPLVGVGPGALPALRGSQPFQAHLTPLGVAATLGLPALGALGLLVTLLWRERARPTDLVTWGLLAGLALDGLGQDVEDFRHVWIALGLADAGRRRT